MILSNHDGRPAVSSITSVFSITADDTTALTKTAKAIYCGVGGNLNVKFVDGSTGLLKNLAYGMWHPMEVTYVYSSQTTATDILGSG